VQRRLAGTAQLPVTPIGLGLAALGRPGYINLGHADDLGPDRSVTALEAHARTVLDAAYDAGIRYFDAARSYGRAELFLAGWLETRDLAPTDVTVASKWGYTYTADWQVDAETHEVKDHSVDAFERQVEQTRHILGDHLALYQIHSATLETGVLDDPAVLARLVELHDSGVRVGFTVSGPRQADVVRQGLAASVDGRNPFSEVQATWNVLEPSSGAALREAHEAGWVVVGKEALANGRLTDRNDEPALADARRLLHRIAERHGCGIDAVAIAAVAEQPFVDVVLSGAATPAQVRSNSAATDVRLDDAALAELAALAEDPVSYWQQRSALPWR
jgi:aryl-alcohol dehydrogenase-like predicted oxidoreductase